ncbi:hypothetical protein M2323_004031 [Rhodoblastus acidophilus]|uniref:helix-turn-helix domain-containing protein n=1 Tax=Rhodoblastus acidophilus TaxID=1074 RepID=UPI002225AFBC|nr:helix-turn-helix domain-containing protein [Rhodoblastus acidophilus]MCW2286230.1 hypothetical protein [Rhodoblastus acidophilus]MCW2335087.1 hypothetical protein [Rhodoblastus acidophilus]
MPRGGKRAGSGRPRGVGRPTDFKPEFVAQAKKLCALGATTFDLATFFNVSSSTIKRWAALHSEFSAALVVGKSSADDRVERSLFERAVGYSFESEKVFQHAGQVIRAPTVEHVPPDPGAAMNWLKNRRGDVWRDKHEHQLGGAIEIVSKDRRDAAVRAALRADT